MKMVVGLGNPGPKYRGTRHNVGFEVLDLVAARHQVPFDSGPADALIARWREPASGALLVKPLTFVNNSGQAVGELLRYFRIAQEDLLVVVDEVQLPLGRLRARERGSAGGHNGLKSILAHVGPEFSRLRLGVGRGDARRDLADHVLARFDSSEADEAGRMTARAADAVEMFVADGIAAVMNAFNGGDPATTE